MLCAKNNVYSKYITAHNSFSILTNSNTNTSLLQRFTQTRNTIDVIWTVLSNCPLIHENNSRKLLFTLIVYQNKCNRSFSTNKHFGHLLDHKITRCFHKTLTFWLPSSLFIVAVCSTYTYDWTHWTKSAKNCKKKYECILLAETLQLSP